MCEQKNTKRVNLIATKWLMAVPKMAKQAGSLVMELTHLFISNAGACALWHWALVAPSSWLVSWHGVLLVPAFLLGWRFHGLLCGATKVWPLLLGTCGMPMVCPIGQGRHRHGSLLHGHQPGPFSLAPLWQVGLDLGSQHSMLLVLPKPEVG